MSIWAARAARTLGRGAVLFALWMLLVDNVHFPEIVTGAVTAAVAAVLGEVVVAARVAHARVPAAALRRLHRPFVLLVTDTLRVSLALLQAMAGRQVEGRFRSVRYSAVADTPEDRGRRIFTEWGASLGPNRYVVGIDCEEGYLMIHELVPSQGPLDPLELG